MSIQGAMLFPGRRDTSIAAAESLAGQVRGMELQVYQFILEAGGATCDEVELALGLKHQTASARIRGLAMRCLLDDGGKRRMTRSGRKAIVWQAEDGKALADLDEGGDGDDAV